MSDSDSDLLATYVRDGAHAAFGELVTRHLDLVYSVARRQTGSALLAEEVSQLVFIELARQARAIKPATPLVAWLHVVARRKALNALRDTVRRQSREQRIAADPTAFPMNPEPASPAWPAVEPLLHEAVDALAETDRAAILLRFFENKSLRDVGAALGISDDAAQKRVSRALEQLRTFFLRRGIAVTAAGLATDLSAHALHVAPAGLGAAISAATTTTTATAAAAVGTAAITTLAASPFIVMTTLQKALVVAAFVAVGAAGLHQTAAAARQSTDLAAMRERVDAATAALARLRVDRETVTARLAAVERAIDARLAHAKAAGTPEGALTPEMHQLLDRIDRVKEYIEAHPELQIPELRLLEEKSWLMFLANRPMDSEEALRTFTAEMRRMAEMKPVDVIQNALARYLAAHDGMLPGKPRELIPFLAQPLDPAILDRYTLTQSGKFADVPPTEQRRVLMVKAPADSELDSLQTISPVSNGSIGPAMAWDLDQATRRFQAANPGQAVMRVEQVRPYLQWPVSDTALQALMDRLQARKP